MRLIRGSIFQFMITISFFEFIFEPWVLDYKNQKGFLKNVHFWQLAPLKTVKNSHFWLNSSKTLIFANPGDAQWLWMIIDSWNLTVLGCQGGKWVKYQSKLPKISPKSAKMSLTLQNWSLDIPNDYEWYRWNCMISYQFGGYLESFRVENG